MKWKNILRENDLEIEINKIYNENCLDTMANMENDFIDLILTDIPYGQKTIKSNGIRIFDKKDANIPTFDLQIFLNELNRICKGSIYIFCGISQISEIHDTLFDYNLSVRKCIWEKINPMPINAEHIWLSGIELCVFAKNKNATYNEFCKNPVWKYPCGRSDRHPTEKPLKLFEYLIKTSSNETDLVYDPCFGSGTTLEAAKKLNRKFIGSEISKDYCEIANARLRQGYLF